MGDVNLIIVSIVLEVVIGGGITTIVMMMRKFLNRIQWLEYNQRAANHAIGKCMDRINNNVNDDYYQDEYDKELKRQTEGKKWISQVSK